MVQSCRSLHKWKAFLEAGRSKHSRFVGQRFSSIFECPSEDAKCTEYFRADFRAIIMLKVKPRPAIDFYDTPF